MRPCPPPHPLLPPTSNAAPYPQAQRFRAGGQKGQSRSIGAGPALIRSRPLTPYCCCLELAEIQGRSGGAQQGRTRCDGAGQTDCSGRGAQLPARGLPAHHCLGHRDTACLQGVPGALPQWRRVALRDRGGDRTEEAEQVRFGGHSGLAIGERAADYSLALQIPGEDRWGTLNPKPPSPTNDSPPPPPPFRGGLLRQYCNWASMTNCWPPPLPLQVHWGGY